MERSQVQVRQERQGWTGSQGHSAPVGADSAPSRELVLPQPREVGATTIPASLSYG